MAGGRHVGVRRLPAGGRSAPRVVEQPRVPPLVGRTRHRLRQHRSAALPPLDRPVGGGERPRRLRAAARP